MKPLRFIVFSIALGMTAFISHLHGQDKVEYTDPKTQKSNILTGDIKEDSVAGVKVSLDKKREESVSAPNINRITYADLPVGLKLEYLSIPGMEDRKEFDKALKGYKDVLPKLPAGSKTKVQTEFRIAMLAAQIADTPVKTSEAMALLEDYVKNHSTTWHFSTAARTLVRLQIAAEKYKDALETLDKLSRAPGLPKELKPEIELATIDILIRDGKEAEALTKITGAMAGLPDGDLQKSRLRIYQIGANKTEKPDAKVTQLKQIIDTTPDPSLRALAFNTLGDVYRGDKKLRDAMWSYLWVDVVYNQDRSEHLKALDRLARLFEAMNDPNKSQEYKEKMARLR